MFMHKELMELTSKNSELEIKCGRLQAELDRLKKIDEQQKELDEEKHSLEIEQVKNEIRKEMQKDLIQSDLERVEAVAKLEAYREMDTKEERKHLSTMLEKAITGLSSQKVQVVK